MEPDIDEGKNLSLASVRNVIKHGSRLTKIMRRGNGGLMIALAIVFGLLALAPFAIAGSYGFLISMVVAAIGNNAISQGLILAFILYSSAQFIMSLLLPVQDYLMKLFISRVNERMDITILEATVKADFALRDDPKQFSLFNNAYENWWRPREFLRRQYFMLQNVIEVMVASVIVLILNPYVYFFILVGTLPELIIESKYGRQVWGIYSAKAEVRRRYWTIRDQFNARNHLFDMKLFQNAGHFLGMLSDLIKRFMVEENKIEKHKLKLYLMGRFLGQATIMGAYAWFIFSAIHGQINIGALVFIIGSIFNFRTSLSAFFQNLGMQFQDSLFIGDLIRLIDIKSVIQRPEKGIVLSSSETPEIIFEHVTFFYPASEQPILKDFSLRIKPGEKVALIGVNGVGKTTLVKLLLRFYDPTEGRILINRHDLKSLDLESWYSLIGVLFQDYANYHLLTKDVIALGRTSKATDIEKVKESARAAEADTFITEWEKNYNQQLGSWLGGIEPSIGQWQKLALARTFYRDPRILILDEPTSSIDAEAEAKIFEKLESLPKDRTVILISHRFSTVRQADQIVVIEDGKIKEHGKHEELLKKKGTYARLFKLQAKGYQ